MPTPPTDSFAAIPPMKGGGAMGNLLRATDWSQTALGDYSTWPQSLRTSLSLVLNAKGIAALYWGEEQWLLYNDAYGSALGERHPWAFGKRMPEVLTDIAPVLSPQVAKVLETGEGFAIEKMAMVMHRLGRDEETFWTYSFSPVQGEDGGFAGVLLLATEMTQQVLADRERDSAEAERIHAVTLLSELNAQLEAEVARRTEDRNSLWLLSSDIMLRCTFEGVITAVNPAWTDVLGWQQSELIGTNLFNLIHPDDLDHTVEGASMSATGHAYSRFDNRYRHKEGHYRWISWSTKPDNEYINAVGRDFTGEHDAAKALAKAEQALRQSQKLEAIGQLTGGVAHDFNNLLTVIRSSADFLKRPDLSDDRRARYVSAISETVERAAKVTSQLLAFARRQALTPVDFVASDSVSALRELIRTLVGSQVEIAMEMPVTKHFIKADPSQFDTAVVNLALNARDAMQGTGKLTIRVELLNRLPSIPPHHAVEAKYIAVSISDTGSGIPAEHMERIFEPFFTTKSVGHGTGLGLSQVFGFAKQSGGEITVNSTIDEGSTFTLYFPEIAQPFITELDPVPHSFSEGSGITVLVVEDNVDVGKFAVQSLKDIGFVPVFSSNAKEALAELATDADRFDVVFSDVVMPGMSGLELGNEIRRLHPDLPVVLTSGYSHVLAEKGSDGFDLLQKPYSVEQIARLLRKASSSRRRIGSNSNNLSI